VRTTGSGLSPAGVCVIAKPEWIGRVPQVRQGVPGPKTMERSPHDRIACIWRMGLVPQDYILGNFQPSLAGLVLLVDSYPALRAGLFSAVPSGLNP
jgi:hypothetical protein